uniref:Uncharacterized protein n=1 Tax=Arundo donax TaxID=35708 RepID=A0A0A9EQJ5_ARUDO
MLFDGSRLVLQTVLQQVSCCTFVPFRLMLIIFASPNHLYSNF